MTETDGTTETERVEALLNRPRYRVALAAIAAGMDVTDSSTWQRVEMYAPDSHTLWVEFDKLGRLTRGKRWEPSSARPVWTLPAADLEERALAWIAQHGTKEWNQ